MVESGDDMLMEDKGRDYDKGIFYFTFSYNYMKLRGWDQARGGGGGGV